jgi:hypothetical protein
MKFGTLVVEGLVNLCWQLRLAEKCNKSYTCFESIVEMSWAVEGSSSYGWLVRFVRKLNSLNVIYMLRH